MKKTSSAMLSYSNVRDLHQATGELCRVCMEFHLSIVCLSETHLYDDTSDSFVFLVTLWQLDKIDLNMSVVVLILIWEYILFEEINTMTISILERAELVTIVSYFFLLNRKK